MLIDSAYALYLQSQERIAVITDAPLAARWGAIAASVSASSCLTVEADANAEAARQIAFIGGPIAEDVAMISKLVDGAALRGRTITLDGQIVFVLGSGVDHASGVSTLNILRRL